MKTRRILFSESINIKEIVRALEALNVDVKIISLCELELTVDEDSTIWHMISSINKRCAKQETLTIEEKVIDKELFTGEYLTVGKLKELLIDIPDDNIILMQNNDKDDVIASLNVNTVDTFWHGALTFSTKD